MQHTWQWQTAKQHFDQIVDDAVHYGPQIVTKRGVEIVVVLSSAEYYALVGAQKKLPEFFRDSPLVGIDLDLTRDSSESRSDLAL